MTRVILSGMGRPSTLDLHESLFRAATARFRERGYQSASISQITHEVGVAKGTFFNYFPTKEHVLSEAYHRLLEQAIGEVDDGGFTGTDAIFVFCRALAERLSDDRVLSEALVMRLSALPTPPSPTRDPVRDEERVRNWIEARLTETLPVSIPLIEADLGLLAFLLAWALRGTVDEWIRSQAANEALWASLHKRVGFLLESAGLPAQAPERRAVR